MESAYELTEIHRYFSQFQNLVRIIFNILKILDRIIYSKSYQWFLFSDQIYASINFKIHYLNSILYRKKIQNLPDNTKV